MGSPLTVVIFNQIGQLPKLSGDFFAVQSVSLLAAYFFKRHYAAFGKSFEMPRNN